MFGYLRHPPLVEQVRIRLEKAEASLLEAEDQAEAWSAKVAGLRLTVSRLREHEIQLAPKAPQN